MCELDAVALTLRHYADTVVELVPLCSADLNTSLSNRLISITQNIRKSTNMIDFILTDNEIV
jgi:hypothetical protein